LTFDICWAGALNNATETTAGEGIFLRTPVRKRPCGSSYEYFVDGDFSVEMILVGSKSRRINTCIINHFPQGTKAPPRLQIRLPLGREA
jgi:hypothetical protein